MRQKRIGLSLGILLGGLLVVVFGGSVKALTQIEQLRMDYDFQHEQYRAADNQFHLSKSQYDSNPTFAHEEELVTGAKQMLAQRAKLWWVYWQTEKSLMVSNRGIDEETKSDLIQKLEEMQQFSQSHQQTLTTVENRSQLLAEAKLFEAEHRYRLGVTYYALNLWQRGKLNETEKELSGLGDRLLEAVSTQIKDENLKQVKIRGISGALSGLDYKEIATTGALWQKYLVGYQPEKVYEDEKALMTTRYQDQKKVFALLTELANGLEL